MNRPRVPLPTVDRLSELLTWDVDKGELRWRSGLTGLAYRKHAGRVAGSNHNGYRRVRIKGQEYPCHRLIYYLATGKAMVPIIHLNGDGLDNRIENLQEIAE